MGYWLIVGNTTQHKEVVNKDTQGGHKGIKVVNKDTQGGHKGCKEFLK